MKDFRNQKKFEKEMDANASNVLAKQKLLNIQDNGLLISNTYKLIVTGNKNEYIGKFIYLPSNSIIYEKELNYNVLEWNDEYRGLNFSDILYAIGAKAYKNYMYIATTSEHSYVYNENYALNTKESTLSQKLVVFFNDKCIMNIYTKCLLKDRLHLEDIKLLKNDNFMILCLIHKKKGLLCITDISSGDTKYWYRDSIIDIKVSENKQDIYAKVIDDNTIKSLEVHNLKTARIG